MRGCLRSYTASGPVTNVAARLCALAGPGATAVSADVVKLVGGRFDFESLGVRELKNVRGAVEVHRSQNLVPVLAVATTLFLAFLALALVEGTRNQHRQ